MKKLLALTSACLLFTSVAMANQPTQADQKWLEVVEKKITAGETQVSTPASTRVELLKDWAGRNGYSIQVTTSENNYRLALSKSLAQK